MYGIVASCEEQSGRTFDQDPGKSQYSNLNLYESTSCLQRKQKAPSRKARQDACCRIPKAACHWPPFSQALTTELQAMRSSCSESFKRSSKSCTATGHCWPASTDLTTEHHFEEPTTWESVDSRSTKKFTKTLKTVKHLALGSLFHRHWLLHWMKLPVVAELERQNHRIPLKTEIHKDRTRRGISKCPIVVMKKNNDTSSPHKSDHVHQVGVSNIQALGRNARHFSSAWPGHRCWWPNWKSSALGNWKADMPQVSNIDIHHFTQKSSLANRLQ